MSHNLNRITVTVQTPILLTPPQLPPDTQIVDPVRVRVFY